jgi:helix-turn-helix, Psq domain
MDSPPVESRIIMALKAMENDPELSLRGAATIYNVPRTTLSDRRAGKPARRDTAVNSRKLTDLEEKTIIQYIIELYARAFHPRLCYVEDMANRLLRERDAPPVGIRWAHNFVKR